MFVPNFIIVVQTFSFSWWCNRIKSHRINKIRRVYPLGTLHVCTTFLVCVMLVVKHKKPGKKTVIWTFFVPDLSGCQLTLDGEPSLRLGGAILWGAAITTANLMALISCQEGIRAALRARPKNTSLHNVIQHVCVPHAQPWPWTCFNTTSIAGSRVPPTWKRRGSQCVCLGQRFVAANPWQCD